MTRAMLARGHPELCAKRVVEVREVVEAGGERHVDYFRISRGQARCGFAQPRSENELMRRDAGHGPERPQEMIRAQAGVRRQCRQGVRRHRVAFDGADGGADPVLSSTGSSTSATVDSVRQPHGDGSDIDRQFIPRGARRIE
jgi:hypothetical protein